jgi:hypothetical protein
MEAKVWGWVPMATTPGPGLFPRKQAAFVSSRHAVAAHAMPSYFYEAVGVKPSRGHRASRPTAYECAEWNGAKNLGHQLEFFYLRACSNELDGVHATWRPAGST